MVEVQGLGREGDDQDPDSSLGNGFWINVGQRSLTWLRLGTRRHELNARLRWPACLPHELDSKAMIIMLSRSKGKEEKESNT